MESVITELVLIRHGETDWNKEHRLQGQAKPGPPLNDKGIQQTQMLSHVIQKRYKHFDAVISSDLLRTMQTAQILAAGYQLEVQQHPGLRERHIGVLQGLTNVEAPQVQPEAWAALQSGSHDARIPGGGESLNDLKARLHDTLLDIAARYPGKRVLVISHGGALHATHRAARGYEAQGKVTNCSISVVRAELAVNPEPEPQQQQQQQHCKWQHQWQHQQGKDSPAYSTIGADDDTAMQSGSSASADSADTPLNAAGLLLASNSSQASGYCSSSCCGCCYCLGDSLGDDITRDDYIDDDVMISHENWMDVEAAEPAEEAAAAAAAAAFFGMGPVCGKLSMSVWNDASALLDLEAEEGVGLRAAGFGGSAREA